MTPTKVFATLATTAFVTAATLSGASAADRGYHSGYDRHGSKARVAVINFRISNQRRRIRRGRRVGKLTWVEARKLRFELSHIRGFRARYLRDGWLSRLETRHLKRLLNDNSRRIWRFARNGFDSYRRYGRHEDRVYRHTRKHDGRRYDRNHRDYRSSRFDERRNAGRRDRNRTRERRDTRRGYDKLSRLNGFH